MSIHDWKRHGDTNVGMGMVPSRSEREQDRQNRTLATMRARIEELTRERDALRAALADIKEWADTDSPQVGNRLDRIYTLASVSLLGGN